MAHRPSAAGAPEDNWALSTAHQIHRQIAELERTRATSQLSVRVAPRRWRLRGEVEHESRRIAKLDLLANAVVGLVRASTTDVYGPQPIPSPLGQQIDALGGALERLASAPQPWPSELPAEIASVVAAVTERATAFAANRVEIVGSIVRAAAADLAAAIDVHD